MSTNERLKTFALGSFTGLATTLIVQPLEVVRSKAQGELLHTKNHVSFFNTSVSIWKQSGFRGFWNGLIPSITRASIGPGLYFLILEEITNPMQKSDTIGMKAFEGATARTIASTITCPITVIKTRFEVASGSNPSMFAMAAKIAREEGIRGLFGGLRPLLLRDVPQSGLYLFFFADVYKPFFAAELPSSVFSDVAITAISAGSAAVTSTVLTHPADVLRANYQMSFSAEPVLMLIRRLMTTHGFTAFFTGLTTRIVRAPVRYMITWSVYDTMKRVNE